MLDLVVGRSACTGGGAAEVGAPLPPGNVTVSVAGEKGADQGQNQKMEVEVEVEMTSLSAWHRRLTFILLKR